MSQVRETTSESDWEDETESDWEDISFIISSRYRFAVVEQLAEAPATPTQIASDTEIVITHVSRALRELRDRSLVELLVPEQKKKGRVYDLVEETERLLGVIDSKGLARHVR